MNLTFKERERERETELNFPDVKGKGEERTQSLVRTPNGPARTN
jgi:hypothetical protein